jgi:peptidoglycan/LPS O-acetylase OafA/YrhL
MGGPSPAAGHGTSDRQFCALIRLVGKRLSWEALFAVTLVTTGALAFMSWHRIEKRALRPKPTKRENSPVDTPLKPERIPS